MICWQDDAGGEIFAVTHFMELPKPPVNEVKDDLSSTFKQKSEWDDCSIRS